MPNKSFTNSLAANPIGFDGVRALATALQDKNCKLTVLK